MTSLHRDLEMIAVKRPLKKKIKVLFWFLKHKQNKTLTVIKFFFF